MLSPVLSFSQSPQIHMMFLWVCCFPSTVQEHLSRWFMHPLSALLPMWDCEEPGAYLRWLWKQCSGHNGLALTNTCMEEEAEVQGEHTNVTHSRWRWESNLIHGGWGQCANWKPPCRLATLVCECVSVWMVLVIDWCSIRVHPPSWTHFRLPFCGDELRCSNS